MRQILDIIGAVICLLMIIAGVLLSVIKSHFLILVLPAMLGLWVFVNLCDRHLRNAAEDLASRKAGRPTTRK
jgi:hypothetical protein